MIRFIVLCLFVFTITNHITAKAIELSVLEDKMNIKIDENTTFDLIAKGQGIRHKKFAMFNISVYQGKLFTEEKIKSAKAFIKSTSNIAIEIIPLRSFGGDKLKEAMVVSYEKNKVDYNSKHQTELLDILSKNKITKNVPVYIIGYTKNSVLKSKPAKIKNKELKSKQNSSKDVANDSDVIEERIYLKNESSEQLVIGPKGFINEVFSIWLGEPVDADMEKLKSNFFNN